MAKKYKVKAKSTRSGNTPSRVQLAKKSRNYTPQKRSKAKKLKLSKSFRSKLYKVTLFFIGILMVAATVGGLWLFSYLQELSDDLPPVDNPFRDKELASVVYDRDGTELYKLFNEYNRDSVDIEEIPEHVKWAFLAAEDVDFYTHQGFDPVAILRCGVYYIQSGGSNPCGGSTITQQMVKITDIGGEVKVERKLRELLMALKVEQTYTKDEILQIYLTVAPFGSSIYGITTAADFYFGKTPADLTLAEATILASIIQNPYYLSPTLAPDTEVAQARVKVRQEYVLDQIGVYMNKINAQNRVNTDDLESDDLFTEEMIEQARGQKLKYRPPIATNIKAGHFVNYALDLLQERNYKNGEEPFTLSDLQTGGYEIYTTLDYDLQQVAENTVKDAVRQFGAPYRAANASMMTLQPKTGEILVMVGSKDYYGRSSGCNNKGTECAFDPQVNIMNSRQSPGSSTKPYGTYEAYRQGLLAPGSFLPDIPVDLGNGFNVKNWNGTYFGVSAKTTAGQMLSDSRNLPAIIVVEMIGIERFLDVMTEFGYSTYSRNRAQFGHSVILGGADVIGIEHAQGFATFANNGNFIKHEVISKIVDREGNIIYQHKPKRKRVGDPQASFLLNQSLLNSHSVSWDGRDVAGKTGTSENSTDAWTVMWSPDFVTIGWMGNNNNKEMDFNAFGVTVVQPWLKNYMRQVGGTKYFRKKSNFVRPGGIVVEGGCSAGKCQGFSAGFMIADRKPPIDVYRTRVRVCTDQPTLLARPIDEALGFAKDRTFSTYIMPVPHWQGFLDKFLKRNGPPTASCTKDRSGQGAAGPWFNSFSPGGGATVSGSINFQGSTYSMAGNITKVEFFIDNVLLGQVANKNVFDVTYGIPGNLDDGTYQIKAISYDNKGKTFTHTSNVIVDATVNPNMSFSSPIGPLVYDVGVGNGKTQVVTMNYAGPGSLSGVQLYVQKNAGGYTLVGTMGNGGGGVFTLAWGGGVANEGATYRFYVTASNGNTGSLQSGVSADVVVNSNP